MLDAIVNYAPHLVTKSLWLLLFAIVFQVARKSLLTRNPLLAELEARTSLNLTRTLYVLAVVGVIVIIAL